MRFEAGESGNPSGRPKGSYGGRIQALAGLDKLLARKKNQQALIAALEKDLQKDPVRFFKTVIMPLLPKESKLSFDHDGIVEWRSLLGVTVKLKDGKLVTEEPATIEGEVVDAGKDLSLRPES
jgi:hypothetical protein